MPFMPSRMATASFRPLRCPRGRSICVMSPVMIIFVLVPMRVRNILICAVVVFCASSRMTTASLSVRPRMKARGAICMTCFSIMSCSFTAGIMSSSAS